MRISRLLALPLALSFAAIAAAQSSPSPQSMAPVTTNLPVQSHLLELAPNSGTQSPTLHLQLHNGVVSNAPSFNFFPASGLAGRTLIQLSPSAQPSAAGTAPSIDARTQAELLAKLQVKVEALKLHPELLMPERCYAIRDYTFSRDDPNSDALRLKSYTACEPSTEARLLHTGPGRSAARP